MSTEGGTATMYWKTRATNAWSTPKRKENTLMKAARRILIALWSTSTLRRSRQAIYRNWGNMRSRLAIFFVWIRAIRRKRITSAILITFTTLVSLREESSTASIRPGPRKFWLTKIWSRLILEKFQGKLNSTRMTVRRRLKGASSWKPTQGTTRLPAQIWSWLARSSGRISS